MPSSGSRSGTRPGRPTSAGDGRIGVRRLLRCDCTIPLENHPVAVTKGRRWYACPTHGLRQEKATKR